METVAATNDIAFLAFSPLGGPLASLSASQPQERFERELVCPDRKQDEEDGCAACCMEGLLEGWFGYLRREDRRRHQRVVQDPFQDPEPQGRAAGQNVYADEKTGKTVDAADQVKGFEIEKDEFLQIEPDDIKALKLTSDHTLEVGEFVSIDKVDTRYLEKPYYLIPADRAAVEAYGLMRDAMKNKGVAARSCIVLYQRGREVLIQPYGKGMVMTEIRNRNEMVSQDSVFDGLTTAKYDPELLEIAGMLIDKKVTTFDPSKFEDTYEDALIAVIDAKRKGKAPPKPAHRPKENVINLAEVLKKSLKQEGWASPKKTTPTKRKSA